MKNFYAISLSLFLSATAVFAQEEVPIDSASVATEATADTMASTSEVPIVEDSNQLQADSTSLVANDSSQQQADSVANAEQPAVPAPVEPIANVNPLDSAAVGFVADAAPPKLTGTEIGGEMHGFLKADKSPYFVKESITISPNMALVIDAGTTILFDENASLFVNQGQLVVAGNSNAPVVFKSASAVPKAGDWKGVFVTGEALSEFRFVQIIGAESGLVLEKANVSAQGAVIEGAANRGIYAHDSKLFLNKVHFIKNKIGLHVDNYSDVEITNGSFDNNNVAMLSSELSRTKVSATNYEENDVGLLNMGNVLLSLNNSLVTKNGIGISSAEILDAQAMEAAFENHVNYSDNAQATQSILPAVPEFPGVEKRPLNKKDNLASLFAVANKDTTTKGWSILGNVMLGGYYHHVLTQTHKDSVPEITGTDTVFSGEHYKNYFQVPGFGGNLNAYVLMESSKGQVIEFSTDMTTDSWNHFSPNPISLRYTDDLIDLSLGDFQMNGGDIYMAGIPVFGAGLTLSFMKNNAEEPLFQLGGFYGELKRSLVPGERHPYFYNEYIDDGEAQAQRIAYNGFFKWAPLRRFDMKIGAIYADDEIQDPIIRDGASGKTTTLDPLQESMTMYAEGNWLFFPGDIELNGQIAVGRADTADVIRQRAINKVFSKANLKTSSYTLLRTLMQNESRIDRLSKAELDEIFDDNSAMSKSQMIEKLHKLIQEAKKVQKEEESDRDDGRVLGENWGSENFAMGASLNWNIYKTHINGHVKYVGENYYSAGSPDQLSNTREFGAIIEQDVFGVWDVALRYQINVENAAKGSKSNLIGLGEGTHWGLPSDEDDDWFDKHELDNDRTRYIQNAGIDNLFKIGSRLELNLGYDFEYKTQYRPIQLHGNYSLEDGVYRDSYFTGIKGTRMPLIYNDDTVLVNTSRWNKYISLASQPYLASKFHEKLMKHSFDAGFSLKISKSVLKVNGRWTIRTDESEFEKDQLIDSLRLDFADTTWAKMGYYFGAANFFEQTYPIIFTTTLPSSLQNRFAFTTRIKNYKRDDMSELEFTAEDNLEIPFMQKFMILEIDGQFRYMTTNWSEGDSDYDESEMDILGRLNLRLNHTKHFYSEWYTGTAIYFRPDYLANEYKDIYGGINLNYVF